MSFCLVKAIAAFQRLTGSLLKKPPFASVSIDSVVLFSLIVQDCVDQVSAVFRVFESADRKIKKYKNFLAERDISIPGYMEASTDIRVDPRNTSCINYASMPTSKKSSVVFLEFIHTVTAYKMNTCPSLSMVTTSFAR